MKPAQKRPERPIGPDPVKACEKCCNPLKIGSNISVRLRRSKPAFRNFTWPNGELEKGIGQSPGGAPKTEPGAPQVSHGKPKLDGWGPERDPRLETGLARRLSAAWPKPPSHTPDRALSSAFFLASLLQ
ncbi:MAG: hypothetical protein CL936_02755 [Deltaproteobacteria bacterium]|nr:hypothetical protein [Deltaproteobacteria bacterium]